MTNVKLKEILENKINFNDVKDFYIGEIIHRPNACGCVCIQNNWFIYKRMDEYCYLSLSGPFNDNEIIFACSWLLEKESLFSEYETEAFYDKYLHNHFSSIEEVKEKYPELK